MALPQGLAILIFGFVIGVSLTWQQAMALLPVALAVAIFGGAFGMIIMANISSQRAANQVFPFIMLPQFFLAGVFSPIQVLPWYLDILSRISPMRYAVDFTRSIFYAGHPDYPKVVLQPATVNVAIIAGLFLVFIVVGTWLFVRSEGIGELLRPALLATLQVISRMRHSMQNGQLPPDIGQLANLEKLDIRYNNLTILPREIIQLTSLKLLDLSKNNFAPNTFPPELVN